jgi:hypothetical protein
MQNGQDIKKTMWCLVGILLTLLCVVWQKVSRSGLLNGLRDHCRWIIGTLHLPLALPIVSESGPTHHGGFLSRTKPWAGAPR